MTGDHITEPLDYLYEELSPEGMAEARRHLASCPACRREMRAIRETVKLYRETPRPAAPDGLAERAAAAALAGLARPADRPAAKASPDSQSGRAVPTGEAPPVLYPPPPRTPLPYPDMEKEFARLKEEVMRDAPKGLRSWLFHPAWTVAASVIFLCALLMHLSPRMQSNRPMVIPAAPTRPDDAARQIRLRERIPPSEPRTASLPPAGEPPPILSEAEAVNRLDLEQILADEDEPPRGKFTLTRVNPTALLEDSTIDASSAKQMDITATPGGWVASGTGAVPPETPPSAAPPPPAQNSEPSGLSFADEPVSPEAAGTVPLPTPRFSEPSAAAARPRAAVADRADDAARDNAVTERSGGTPSPLAAAGTSPSHPAASPVTARPGGDGQVPHVASSRAAPAISRPQRSGSEAATAPSAEAESGPVVSTPLTADDDAAFDGLIVDWEDIDNPPQIVPRPTPLDVPERVRVLTALVGMQIAHREWADAWRTVALVEAYDKKAAENLRSLVRTAQDADRDAVSPGSPGAQSDAALPVEEGGAEADSNAIEPENGTQTPATEGAPAPNTHDSGEAPGGHPLRPDAAPSDPVRVQSSSARIPSDPDGRKDTAPSSSSGAGHDPVTVPSAAINGGTGTGAAAGEAVWRDIPNHAGTGGDVAASRLDTGYPSPAAPAPAPSTGSGGDDGFARQYEYESPGRNVPAAPEAATSGVRVTPVYSTVPSGTYVAEPIIMPPIVMDSSGRMPQVVLLTQEQAAELHAAGRLQYAVPPTVIPAPERPVPAQAASAPANASSASPTVLPMLEQAIDAGATQTLTPSTPTDAPASDPGRTSRFRERPKGFSTDPYVRGY